VRVRLTKGATKQLRKAPHQVQRKLKIWIDAVGLTGLDETRKIPGYHDEPLQNKFGRRSIRLNKQWRAEYVLEKDEDGNLVVIMEVHPHEY